MILLTKFAIFELPTKYCRIPTYSGDPEVNDFESIEDAQGWIKELGKVYKTYMVLPFYLQIP